MSWEGGDRERGWTRREWVRFGMAVGTIGTIGSLGALSGRQLTPPPIEFTGEIRETLYYTRFPTAQWWNDKAGQPMKLRDFELWRGATGVWRGLFQNDQYVPGTGFPVLVIRVARDLDNLSAPADVELPEGFDLWYDEEPAPENDDEGVRLLVVFDRCVHLCCYPGWHVIAVSDFSYVSATPTKEVHDEDPIYCICHGSQYEPMHLVKDVNPKNGAVYVGTKYVHGPATRGLPVVPVKVEGGNIVGGMPDPRWYAYCG